MTLNPLKGSIIKKKPTKRTVNFVDSDDIQKLLAEAHKYGYIYWIFFKTLIETGLRKGEAAALKWDDINFKNNTIRIDETLDFQASGGNLFGETKTLRSERTVNISTSLANDLRYHANWQNKNKLNLGEMYNHELNLVLCRDDGNFMPKSSLFNAFQRILNYAGLPSLAIHSLRHTRAVLLLEAGADMKYVQEQLGHNSMQITSDVYSHISKKLEKKNIDIVEAYTKKVIGDQNKKSGDDRGIT